jgi:hypothetical protein
MGVVICIFVMVLTIALGRYVLAEGQRLERKKKFFKNINEYDKKLKKKENVSRD